MWMVLSDIFDSIKKRKIRYILFFIQMMIIFIIIQYTFHLCYGYKLYENKLYEISANHSSTYFTFQDSYSAEYPDCTFEKYCRFKEEVNKLCNHTAFSFGVSDIQLTSKHIPKKFVYVMNGNQKYYQVTYVSEHFLDYYKVSVKKGETFSEQDYNQESENYIPVLLGADYGKYINIGDILDGRYVVKGILAENASYLDTQLSSDIVYLDTQIVIPMLYQAKEWGGCYVNHLIFSTEDEKVTDKVLKIIERYGFKDYVIKDIDSQLKILYNDFLIEICFMGVLFATLFLLCVFSTISMLQHLIEEQKTEFGIYMLCGASKKDICMKIAMPIMILLFLASIPSIGLCKSIYSYLFQFLSVWLILTVLMFFPLLYWLKKPIAELKKERK